MQEIISAIWLQDFDALLELNSLHVLLLLLGVVLFLESSFVFLPLPGDGLVLFVGGMVGLGAIDFSSALMLLTSASFWAVSWPISKGAGCTILRSCVKPSKPFQTNHYPRQKDC